MYGNANMAAMGGMGGMGGMGMVNMTGFPMMGLGNMNLANMFMYSGNCIGLQSKLESLNTTDIGNIK
jgi:hypothetical protein